MYHIFANNYKNMKKDILVKSVYGSLRYTVDEYGVIFDLKNNRKANTFKQKVRGKESGYVYCSLAVAVGYGFKPTAVHRVVCMAFNGLPPKGKEWVNHIDGNKSNNHYSNLEWSSVGENIKHAYDLGLKVAPKGSSHYNFGKKIGKETVAKMSLAKLGENHPKFKGWYCFGGERYGSAALGAKAHGTYAKKVYNLAMSGEGGWSFERVS